MHTSTCPYFGKKKRCITFGGAQPPINGHDDHESFTETEIEKEERACNYFHKNMKQIRTLLRKCALIKLLLLS